MEVLQSKYSRLCAEYKRLRNVHNNFKESTLQELKEAKEQYARLKHDVQQKLKTNNNSGDDLTVGLPETNGRNTMFQKCSVCGRGDQMDAKSLSENAQRLCSSGTEDLAVNPKSALDRFTTALVEWATPSLRASNTESSYFKSMDESQSRIAELESQLCDLSLQYQMERKRRLLSNDYQNKLTDENRDGKSVTKDTEESIERCYETEKRLLLKFMQERIKSANALAQCATARANLFEEELRALVPHLHQLAKELTQVREQCLHQTEVYSASQLDMLNKSNSMAEQLADLTAEVQRLRAGNAS